MFFSCIINGIGGVLLIHITNVSFHQQHVTTKTATSLLVTFTVDDRPAKATVLYNEHLMIQFIRNIQIEGKTENELGNGRIAYFLTPIVQEKLHESKKKLI